MPRLLIPPLSSLVDALKVHAPSHLVSRLSRAGDTLVGL